MCWRRWLLPPTLWRAMTARPASGIRARNDEYPPVPPLCQVMAGTWFGGPSVIQNNPDRRFGRSVFTPSIEWIAATPGAEPSRTPDANWAMSPIALNRPPADA